MVVGNGLVAKAFYKYKDSAELVLFCSGVSDSTCREPAEFKREADLLASTIAGNPDKKIVYFSTCSIEDPSIRDSLYVAHKQGMEKMLATLANSYRIFRLSNLVGYTANKVTVLNFLFNAIKSGSHFNLWQNSSRNIIDIDDVSPIVSRALETGLADNSLVNIANTISYDVPFIVRNIESFLGRKGNYTLQDFGARYSISTEAIKPIIFELGIDFREGYLQNLLHKYYSK